MAEHFDLEKHRKTLNEKLASLSNQVQENSAGNEAVVELVRLLVQMVEHLEAYLKVHEARSIVIEKLILAAPRLSNDYEAFKKTFRKLEEQFDYYPKK